LAQLSPVARTDETRSVWPDMPLELLDVDPAADPVVDPPDELEAPIEPVTSTRCPTYFSRF
jgi:hypothetical protein